MMHVHNKLAEGQVTKRVLLIETFEKKLELQFGNGSLWGGKVCDNILSLQMGFSDILSQLMHIMKTCSPLSLP